MAASVSGCASLDPIEDDWLLGLIRDSYVASSGVYRSRRICGDLREAGEACSKHRVAEIMKG